MKSLLIEFLQTFWIACKLPFLLVGEGFRRLYRLGFRRIIMLTVAVMIVFLLTAVTFMKVTSRPSFCVSCHLMEPYFESWQESSHGDVSCMKCHAQEGLTGYLETKFTAASMLVNYATGLYKRSRPWAEVDDNTCLQSGCHDSRLLQGRVEYTKGVVFDHEPHLTETRRGRKLRCTSCHSQIVQGEHITVTSSTCFLCHFKNIAQSDRSHLMECLSCHTPPSGEDAKIGNLFDHTEVLLADVTCTSCHKKIWQGTGQVRKERCGSCHSEAAHIDRIDDLDFIHEWHIEKRKVDCQRCHDAIEHHQPEAEQILSSDCASCHVELHDPMLSVYKGEGSQLIEQKMPADMHDNGVVCLSCHKDADSNWHEQKVGEEACTPCHNETFRKLPDYWRRGIENRIGILERKLARAGEGADLTSARYDLELIKSGGGWHNPLYADVVLHRVEEVVDGKKKPFERDRVAEKSRECLSCHIGILTLGIEKMWSDFSHTRHLTDYNQNCQDCHNGNSPGTPPHGKLLPVGESCMNCHHEVVAVATNECEPCHIPSRQLYYGMLRNQIPDPSPMGAEEMSCGDCHFEEDGFSPPSRDFCLDCHDEEVVGDLDVQRAELNDALHLYPHAGDSLYQLIKLDQGRAVHHPDLVRRLLKQP